MGERHQRAARRLRRAGAVATGVHLLFLGALAVTRPRLAPDEEAVPVQVFDAEAARALVDDLIPLPAEPPPPPGRRTVVDQRNDGERPNQPSRYTAEEDSNPRRETRRTLRPNIERTEQWSSRPRPGAGSQHGAVAVGLEPPPFIHPQAQPQTT